jgi:transposase
MAQNFIECDREQLLLMSPSLREWLPEGHLAWFVIDAVAEMDLSPFYARYRQDGWGRAAYDPAMMVAVVLYAYAKGQRSSRGIERECVEDVAYRVIASNLAPDHVTINRFRSEHADALAGLFGSVLSLCARAGMVKAGTIAVDGTKVNANASRDANVDYERIAREILKEAAEVDAAEDELYGEKRGDELPEHLQTSQGRRGWLREAKRQLDEERAKEARPIPRSRPARLKEAKRRLEQELWVESRANAAYEAYRVNGRASDGKRLGASPTPYTPPEVPEEKVNLTDPDSRMLKATRGYIQGYNAQAAVDENQIVIAAEVTVDSPDFGHLEPIVNVAQTELEAAGVSDTPAVLLADAGYWHKEQMENIINRGIQAHPARRRQAQRHTSGLGWRRLCAHATRASDRLRTRALPKTPSDGRAGVRTNEVQPSDRSLPTPRKSGCALGMATDHRHPQPPEATQAPTGRGGGLKRPRTSPIAPPGAPRSHQPGPPTARPAPPTPS